VRVEVNIKVAIKVRAKIHVTAFMEGATYQALPTVLGRTLSLRLGYTAPTKTLGTNLSLNFNKKSYNLFCPGGKYLTGS